MLKTEEKETIIKENKINKDDTGSPEVQIGLLTKNIKNLLDHLKKSPKDNHSRRGLLKMIVKRKRLLKYLKAEDQKRYEKIIKSLGLKK